MITLPAVTGERGGSPLKTTLNTLNFNEENLGKLKDFLSHSEVVRIMQK